MNLKNIKLKDLLICLLVAFLYPIFKYVSASGDKLLAFLDAATIIGLVMVVLGIVNAMVLHGDFDITEFVTRRAFFRKDTKPYDAFKKDKKEQREGRFNTPLLVGIVMLLICVILTLCFY